MKSYFSTLSRVIRSTVRENFSVSSPPSQHLRAVHLKLLVLQNAQQNAWRPVMARPRISAAMCQSNARRQTQQRLTMNVALAFVCLRHKQIRYMSPDTVLIRDCVPSKHFLESNSPLAHATQTHDATLTYVRELTRARSQFCLLIMDIISGAAFPSSLSLPT